MRRVMLAMSLALAGWGGMDLAAHPAFAASLCVGSGPGCYSTIQGALNAAHDGDVIHIGPGTFPGGVTIDKSLSLVGAGPNATIISGGGSVLTIGTTFASSEPTVSIGGVTITGGVARSSSESVQFFGTDGVFALGGGIEIPPGADFSSGATVTISNSVITGNRVAPTTAIDSTIPCPPDITITCINGDLPFALAAGGGIDNWGALTVTNTSITNNLIGAAAGFPSVASDADGAGIANEGTSPSLIISNTIVSGNRASAVAPNGRFADSGGIFDEAGTLTMSNTVVTNNRADLAAAMPSDVASGTLAIAGGVHVAGGVTAASIRNTTISHNSVSMTNMVGDATAFSGGLHTDVNFALSNDVIVDNSVNSTTLPGSTGNAQGDSGAGEMAGTIDNTRFTGNIVTVSSVAGSASASAGAAILVGTLTSSVVTGNHVRATSLSGAVRAAGGGLEVVGAALTVRNTTVSDNTGDAHGRSGAAQGGGIAADGGPLNLVNSNITGNVLSGGTGIVLQGGGLYVTNPLTVTNSAISGNVPDNCFGSSC
jgi:hypothetical protein